MEEIDDQKMNDVMAKMEKGELKNPRVSCPIVGASIEGHRLTLTLLMDGELSNVKTFDPTRGEKSVTVDVGATPHLILVEAFPATIEAAMYALQMLMKSKK